MDERDHGPRRAGLGYLLLLTCVTAAAGTAIHIRGNLPMYESLMMGLLIGVIATVAVHQRGGELTELFDLFRRSGHRD